MEDNVAAGLGLSVSICVGLVCAAVVLAYKYFTLDNDYFDRMGVPYVQPRFLIGSLREVMSKGIEKFDTENMKRHGKIFGIFMGMKPSLVVADLEKLRHIFVKDFDAFTNRAFIVENKYLSRESDKLGMLRLEDDHWKYVRGTLTPAFSTGKLKQMTFHMNTCVENFLNSISRFEGVTEGFTISEYLGLLTLDTIAGVAYGININSFEDPKNEFIRNAKIIGQTAFSTRRPIMLLTILFPKLFGFLNRFGVSVTPKGSPKFFKDIVKEAMMMRKDSEGGALDLLQLMVNAHKLHETEMDADIDKDALKLKDSSGKFVRKGLSEKEILAQGLVFFFAGYDTTANTLGFACYNLATNKKCQDKLREQIMEVMDGKMSVSYEDVQQMPYLRQVIDETLRLYPIAPRLGRKCSKHINIDGLNIPAGTSIVVPVWAMHHDADLYPDPEKFDPERFSPGESAKRSPYSYLPFGTGPRNCIGRRLALLEAEIVLVKLLMKYQLLPCDDTEIPLEVAVSMLTRPKNGIKLRIESV